MILRTLILWIYVFPSITILVGCAVPATAVAIRTESMHDALQELHPTSRLDSSTDHQAHRPARSAAPPGAPQPTLTPPEIRMAYLYEWVDDEGNKHFGGWVAIPLAGFNWVMDDGSRTSPPRSPNDVQDLTLPR